MTDTEIQRRKSICDVAGVKEIEDVSDGFHTFRQLYYQRMMLFAAIVKQNKDKAWKSLRHENGELCFGGGWFVVGIDTPEGSYTYHYEDNYYSLFDCKELERGKHWDGHTEKDVTRLLSLPSAQSEKVNEQIKWERDIAVQQLKALGYGLGEKIRTDSDTISRQAAIDAIDDWWITVDDNRHPVSVIKALPSAQSEQTDCEYCHEDADGYVKPLEKNCHAYVNRGFMGWHIVLKARGWMGEAKINFCPMCGRELNR